MLFLGLAFAGLLILAVCAIKVFAAVRTLGREIERTRERLEPEHSALDEQVRRLDRARE
jgi:hypothetical protein